MTKKKNIITGALFALCLLCSVVWSRNLYSVAVNCAHKYTFENVKTETDAAAFLQQFGWEVEIPAVEAETFTLPQSFDKVYNRYNRMQSSIGLDLTPYMGKTVERRTYTVKNHAKSGTDHVRANIFLVGDKVVAGDIMSVKLDGFMHSLAGEEYPY